MTLDVLSELFGEENSQVIRNITPFAISNAFYEQIYLYYGLDKLSPWVASCNEQLSKGLTHRRGDILEAYMAAIEKDISRNGQGYQEVRDWLLKVMALRLQMVEPIDNSSAFYSVGTPHRSFTVIPPPSTRRNISGRANDDVPISEPTVVFLSTPATNKHIVQISPPAKIWSQASQPARSHTKAKGPVATIMPWSSGLERSSIMTQLREFREFIFENMAQIFRQCHRESSSTKSKTVLFWTTLKCKLDNLRVMISEESQMILLLYYRVIFLSYALTLSSYVYFQLENTQSAIEDLRSVLSFKSHLFNSKIHECAVKRLLSIQSKSSITVITHDVHCQSGVSRSSLLC